MLKLKKIEATAQYVLSKDNDDIYKLTHFCTKTSNWFGVKLGDHRNELCEINSNNFEKITSKRGVKLVKNWLSYLDICPNELMINYYFENHLTE